MCLPSLVTTKVALYMMAWLRKAEAFGFNAMELPPQSSTMLTTGDFWDFQSSGYAT
tara:strand:+ start:563 stop:730 length:168 start_codon:yes stop_codon:yes gene_type:complete